MSMKNLRNSRPVRNSGTVGVERTYPMSAAATSRRTPFSSRQKLPLSALRSRFRQLKSVVLPAPFRPKRP